MSVGKMLHYKEIKLINRNISNGTKNISIDTVK